MDIQIIQVVLDIFEEYGDSIRFDQDRFEEALSDEAPQLLDECYLVILGFKANLFDIMIFDEDIDLRGYVDYLIEIFEVKEEEAVFLVSVMLTLVEHIGYYFEIPNLDELGAEAYQNGDFQQLSIIARSYFLGFGVQQDYEKSFEIYSYLYGHGNETGAYYLGYMYEKGYGVEKNIEKALMYYQSTQDGLCNYRLGILYMQGLYVVQNSMKALDYLACSDYEEAYLYKGILLEQQGEFVLAFESFMQGAKLYQAECIYRVGMALKVGLGVTLNLDEAKFYFQQGYYFLHGDCTYQLAGIYFDGIIVDRDEEKAIHYLKQSAEFGSLDANMIMADFYKTGKYVEKDLKKAAEFYQQASHIKNYLKQESIEGEA